MCVKPVVIYSTDIHMKKIIYEETFEKCLLKFYLILKGIFKRKKIKKKKKE